MLLLNEIHVNPHFVEDHIRYISFETFDADEPSANSFGVDEAHLFVLSGNTIVIGTKQIPRAEVTGGIVVLAGVELNTHTDLVKGRAHCLRTDLLFFVLCM